MKTASSLAKRMECVRLAGAADALTRNPFGIPSRVPDAKDACKEQGKPDALHTLRESEAQRGGNQSHYRRWFIPLMAALGGLLNHTALAAAPTDKLDFNFQVRPILA